MPDENPIQLMLISEFLEKWSQKANSVELVEHTSIEEEGAYFSGKLYDPFAGTTVGSAYFSWEDIVGIISGKVDFFMLQENAAMNICEDGETYGSPELVMDDYGRVHFTSDLEDN